ncbi:hypothetical protein FVE85_9659 [Porphyridium purpureum]|uniref:Retrotransposon gag domain-containing protein n=1 Tax=Porphyridium purpureum TaxID=35688 RepID=A0A5J4YKW0_PORPP|nr:hypothetical protein FVE85_9659 [Porphyridium purpureum]|eukprot:POR0828..scf246_12
MSSHESEQNPAAASGAPAGSGPTAEAGFNTQSVAAQMNRIMESVQTLAAQIEAGGVGIAAPHLGGGARPGSSAEMDERVLGMGAAPPEPPHYEMANTMHVRNNLERQKTWREEFEDLRISEEGSADFLLVRSKLEKLIATTPPFGPNREILILDWMQYAFEGTAKRFLWQLVQRFPTELPLRIPDRMQQRFYNHVHATDLKMQWESLRMGEREGVRAFGNRVADLATCQTVLFTDKDIKMRFLSGLPAALQEWSLMVGASFAEAVSVVRKNALKIAKQRGVRTTLDEVNDDVGYQQETRPSGPRADGVSTSTWLPKGVVAPHAPAQPLMYSQVHQSRQSGQMRGSGSR